MFMFLWPQKGNLRASNLIKFSWRSMPPDPPRYQVLYVYTLAIPPSNSLLRPWMVDFFTRQMLDKSKYGQASIQICTISGIHYWGRCTNCTLSSWSKLYKFVHLEMSVQVCTLLTAREVYKFVHPCQFSFRLISDIHEIVTNCVKYYPNSRQIMHVC